MVKFQIEELDEVRKYSEAEASKLEVSFMKWNALAVHENLNIAIVNDITEEERLGQNCERNVLATAKDFNTIGCGIVSSQMKLSPSTKCIEKLSCTVPWKIFSLGCHPVRTETMNISEETGDKLQLHTVRWKYDKNLADDCMPLWVVTWYETLEANGIIDKIVNVKILVDTPEETEKYFVESEIQPLIDYCSAKANLQLFFANAAKLCHLWEERQKVLHKNNLQREFQETSKQKLDDFTIKFIDHGGHEVVTIYWSIKFDKMNLSITEKIRAEFSENGKKVAEQYNFPEELLLTGKYASWGTEEFINNIARMNILEKP